MDGGSKNSQPKVPRMVTDRSWLHIGLGLDTIPTLIPTLDRFIIKPVVGWVSTPNQIMQ